MKQPICGPHVFGWVDGLKPTTRWFSPFMVSFLGVIPGFGFTTSAIQEQYLIVNYQFLTVKNYDFWWLSTSLRWSDGLISKPWALVPFCSPQDVNLYIIFIQLHPLQIWSLSRCWPIPKYYPAFWWFKTLQMTRGMVCWPIPKYGTSMCGFLPRGMLFMGFLGDFIGHRRALLLTKALVVLGAFLWRPEFQEVARNWNFNPGGSRTWYSPIEQPCANYFWCENQRYQGAFCFLQKPAMTSGRISRSGASSLV